MKVIFVGIHNKPGLAPLCSSTRTGKMVDLIIAQLPGLEFVKTNLFNQETFPVGFIADEAVRNWKKRIEYDFNMIVVGLGTMVNECFRKSHCKCIELGHPSGVWSKIKQEEYIRKAVLKIKHSAASKEVFQNVISATPKYDV